MRSQAGQATLEWIGLVLVAALALGALAAFGAPRGEGRPARDRALGQALAERITCAASGACVVERSSGGVGGGAAGLGAAAPPARGERAAAPPARRAGAVDAFRRVRGVAGVGKRLWILCLGYRRYVYERDHPRAPTEPMPLDAALDIVDTCLNPLGFLEDG